jgi:transcription termination factor NusB
LRAESADLVAKCLYKLHHEAARNQVGRYLQLRKEEVQQQIQRCVGSYVHRLELRNLLRDVLLLSLVEKGLTIDNPSKLTFTLEEYCELSKAGLLPVVKQLDYALERSSLPPLAKAMLRG